MTVINPNSISGITSITLPSGDGNVLTIHTNDGTERFRIDSSGNVKVGSACTISQDGDVFFTGVCTATTLSGAASGLTGTLPAISGANLTNLTAGNLTGALPAISGANLTGIAATDNVRTGILDVAGIATFRNTMNVGTAVTISESGIEATGVGITVANINGGQVSGRRNKIINGAMQISQRNGTSSTNIEGNTVKYHLDRFSIQGAGLDELSAGVAQSTDCPDGFAHSMKITVNTPESSIASNEFVSVYQKMEGQDFQDLAYNTSGAKDITMSFYVKSSITGTFGFTVYRDEPGTDRIINKTYTIDSADTWERKIITIAGDTGKAIQNTTGAVWWNCWHLASGSNYDSSTSGVWQNYATTNWAGLHAQDGVITTNGATWAITGVQLETGSQATAFEHRSFGEELALCRRYYRVFQDGSGGGCYMGAVSYNYDVNSVVTQVNFSPEMRATPTLDNTSGTNYYRFYRNSGYVDINAMNAINGMTKYGGGFNNSDSGNGTAGQTGGISLNNTSAKIAFDAEL